MKAANETVLHLIEGSLVLDPDRTYTVYGETMFAIDIINLDFEHLSWLDQTLVLRELELTNSISILYNPEVIDSLYQLQEASPYYGKDQYEVEATYRRLQTSSKTEAMTERRLAAPIVWTPTLKSKKGKVRTRLIAQGYARHYVIEMVNKFLEVRGEKYMNLTVKDIAERVDEFIRDIQQEEEGKYISKDSDKPCTLYLLRFKHIHTAEEFIKPGITRRSLEERYAQDKNHFRIDILHTVKHPTYKCVELERQIQTKFERFRYANNAKLKNKGDTEVLNIKVPVDEVVKLMGTNSVK